MNDSPNGLAAVLSAALGTRWPSLHTDIRARFTLAPGETRQSFSGTMDDIQRSALGWWIARLIAFVRILPAQRARNVPFEFHLSRAPAVAGGWIKQRLYHFSSGPFEFRSVMSLTSKGELIEQFPWGLGMKIRLSAEGDSGDQLYFRDEGYFLCIGGLRMMLPRWLTVGRFTLLHQNIDRENFVVEIRIDHPVLGRLFYQRGQFCEAGVGVALNAGAAAAPHPARTGVRESACCRPPACACAPHPLARAGPAFGKPQPGC